VFFYCFREREKVLSIYDQVCGARMTASYFRVGGLASDIPTGLLERCQKFVDEMPAHVDEYETLLSKNPIWLARTQGVAPLSAKDAVALGATGPILRGSGVKWDLRKAQPYSGYEKYDFEIPTRQNGDTYDRYIVRLQEMRQSVRILRQAVEDIPAGPIMAKVPKVIKPPVGEVYVSIEAPKGELGYFLVSDGSTQPYRVRVRPPSFINLQSLDRMARGALVADLVAIIGTIDIVLGEIDR
jgi:NADH-quinone oxidoreductase subunit D